jgi:hypothetical protein
MKSTKHTILGLVVLGLFAAGRRMGTGRRGGRQDKGTNGSKLKSPVANEVSAPLCPRR